VEYEANSRLYEKITSMTVNTLSNKRSYYALMNVLGTDIETLPAILDLYFSSGVIVSSQTKNETVEKLKKLSTKGIVKRVGNRYFLMTDFHSLLETFVTEIYRKAISQPRGHRVMPHISKREMKVTGEQYKRLSWSKSKEKQLKIVREKLDGCLRFLTVRSG
jgi:hypothetical protein